MPVIRGEAQASMINSEHRQRIVQQLAKEWAGESTEDGPVIFEIPLEHDGRIDLLVVWDEWKPFSSMDRSNLILDAYKSAGNDREVAQPLGVTFLEAIEQQLLPYAVLAMNRSGEIDEESVKNAMLAEGAFHRPGNKVELRFPTMQLAEQAHRKLTDILPKGYWSIIQDVGYPQ